MNIWLSRSPNSTPSLQDIAAQLDVLTKDADASDVPATMAQLKRKLEQTWQPSAAVLLGSASVTTDMLAAPPAYTLATPLTGGWSNTGGSTAPAGYYLYNGRVFLRGMITGGALSSAAFALPAGLRPLHDTYFSTDANGAYGRFVVTTAGLVTPNVGSTTNMSLNVNFPIF